MSRDDPSSMKYEELVSEIQAFDSLSAGRQEQVCDAVEHLPLLRDASSEQFLFDAAFSRDSVNDGWGEGARGLQHEVLRRLTRLRTGVRVDALLRRAHRLHRSVKGDFVVYLAELASPESIKTLVDAFRDGTLGEVSFLHAGLPRIDEPEFAASLWPDALRALDDDSLRYVAMRLAWTHLEQGCFPETAKAAATSSFVRRLRASIEALARTPVPSGCARYQDDQFDVLIKDAALASDALGYLPSSDSVAVLMDAAERSDAYVAAYAIASLRRLNVAVDTAFYERAASEPYARWELLQLLDEIGAEECKQVPARYTTLEAIAEAKMVEWLAHPCEYGHPPSEIELMEQVDLAEGESYSLLLSVFRFRAAESEPWHAGIAGPFSPSARISEQNTHLTFSRFAEWSSRTPVQHVSDIMDVLYADRDGGRRERTNQP
jgi:hypothetical protein